MMNVPSEGERDLILYKDKSKSFESSPGIFLMETVLGAEKHGKRERAGSGGSEHLPCVGFNPWSQHPAI